MNPVVILFSTVGFDLVFPAGSLRAALVVSLLSVWVLVGLFYFLNRFTRRYYFTVWTGAWLFYALWLMLNLGYQNPVDSPGLMMLKQWCLDGTAVLLIWGSAEFLQIANRQLLFGLFTGFLLVWSYVGAFYLNDQLQKHLPVFALMGLASMWTGYAFYHFRRSVVNLGAGLLSLGFFLWGLHLILHPFIQYSEYLASASFFMAAVLQLFIAVSMIVLVLEEVRVERLHLEQQLRQSEKFSALSRLISGVAHELNNPLTVIEGYTELILNTQELNAKSRMDLEKIALHSHRAKNLVGKFLACSLQIPLQRQPLDLNPLLVEAADRCRRNPQAAGIEVHLDLDYHLPATIADEQQIQLVLLHLVTNACQAMSSQSSPRLIKLSSRQGKDNVQIIVEDSGPGVPDDMHLKIFEPFYTTRKNGLGAGLGLSVAYSIVAAHHGTLVCHRSPLGGASFFIQLPLDQTVSTTPAVVPPVPATLTKSEGPARILVVDDEVQLAEMLGQVLTFLRYTPTICNSGAEAMELIARQEFDLIISDFCMPGMDGAQFYQCLARQKPELTQRLIFITGDLMNNEASKLIGTHGIPYVTKPFTFAEIETAINLLLKNEEKKKKEPV